MFIEDLRVAVYESFVQRGVAPSVDDLQTLFATTSEQIEDGLQQLADSRHLVLDSMGQIAMAHPFSAVPLGFSVMGTKTLWWGGCAWDSFAMPHLLTAEPHVLVATTCVGCGTPHAWTVNRHHPPTGTQVAHFMTPTSRMWDDVVHTCRHQRIFCSDECVEKWLAESGSQRGYVMNLETLWHLASKWYAGRLDRGYQRREPEQSAEYLRSVGLVGGFWGL